jgi:acetyltransferase
MHDKIQPHPLARFFSPRSIAVIGASANPSKLGYAQVKTILDGGYRGRVIPVNPTAGEILGLPCLPDASDLPDGVDLAIVLLPAEKTVGVLRVLAAKGVAGAVIPAGGFAETGSEGAALQEEIRRIVAETGMRVLGPNVPGFINAAADLNATFAGGAVGSGDLAILSQAGSIAYLLMRNAAQDLISFARFICFGNQADLSESDLLDYLGSDAGVGAIAIYLESVRDGRRFVEVASRVSAGKPVVALKGGLTSAGTEAIFSHTASISSPESIYRAAFRKAGVVWANDLGMLSTSALALARQGSAKGNRVAIVTSLAGVGVVAADACERRGLSIAEPSAKLAAKLRSIIPAKGSTRNPIDLTGDVSPAMLAETIRALADSGEYDCILPLVMGVPGSEEFGNAAYAQACTEALGAARKAGLAVVVQWVADEADGKEISDVRRRLHALGVPVCLFPEQAADIIAGLVQRGTFLRTTPGVSAGLGSAVEDQVRAAVKSAGPVLTEHVSKSILHVAGILVAGSRLAASQDEAVRLASEVGYPVVLKLQSPDATHKSDLGGVALDLEDANAVAQAYAAMTDAFKQQLPTATLQGVSVQPMICARGVELICGISDDPQFGKYMMVGLGGIAVEVMQDVSIRLLPLAEQEIREMLLELKCSKLLTGHRGSPTVDMDRLVSALHRVSLLGAIDEVAELELNPLLVSADGVVAHDARIRTHGKDEP